MSLKDTILAANDREVIAEWVPEWKCTVYLSTMTAGAFMDWHASTFDQKGTPRRGEQRQAAALLAGCLVEETGERLFDPLTDADIDALLKKNYKVITRLSNKCMELNFMDTKATEQVEQNF